MITRDKELLDGGLTGSFLLGCLTEHDTRVKEMNRLADAYASKPAILRREVPEGFPNNRLVHNYARYIVAVSSGYLIGNPVSYEGDSIEPLTDAYSTSRIDSVDAEMAKDAALYGKGVELCYVDGEANPRTAALDPRTAFVVYGNDVGSTPLMGVRYYATYNMEGRQSGAVLHVYDADFEYIYRGQDQNAAVSSSPEIVQHMFGGVPVIEYWNNDDETGDFEHVLSLIDAYDKLQSDRLNDKEQFVQAILVLTGVRMESEPDVLDREGNVIAKGRTPAQQIRYDKMLMLPDSDAAATYLYKQLAESDVEILKQGIKGDIHKFSMVPDLTDEHFAGNISGVAMKYKLFGLEQLTAIKERWFEEALRARMKLFAEFLAVKGQARIDPDTVTITFKRTLPANELELAQMVSSLSGIVPTQTLLAQLPFIQDPEEEAALLAEEKERAAKTQQAAFGFPLADEE